MKINLEVLLSVVIVTFIANNMNIMRKLRGGGTNVPSSSNTEITDHPPGSPHTQLGLMHLKKLFAEYTHPSHPLTEAEKNDKLYNMLPLFCKVRKLLILLSFELSDI